ncbi:unnamed protein product [Owenia fusiformis]|uniref:Uncharacterized protein n=1 Tax=Owenia fusiformis TaxID=6347 RepID=A0A8J1U2F6_OWEFU|nr:unnamed protein product [Owenia fusiformis]
MFRIPTLVIFYLVSLICISAKDNREDDKWNIPWDGDDEDIPPYKGQVDEMTDIVMLRKQRAMRRGRPPTIRKPKLRIQGGKIDERKKMFDPSLDFDEGPILDDLRNETGGGRCAIKHMKGKVVIPEKINKKNERRKQNIRKVTNKSNKIFRKLPAVLRGDKNDIEPAVDPNFYVKIPVKLHVIYSRFGGWIDGSKIKKTINRLNRAYEGVLGKVVGPDTGIRFELDEVTRTDDMKMFFYCDLYYKELKAKYVVEPEKYINIITCDPYHDTAGWSSFPHEGPENSSIHGIFLHHEALFGSIRFPRWNRGMTLIHEMGHYLGLYHTFHNEKCHNASHPEEDDGVIDTPPEAMMALWCDDIGRDTCTGPGESLPTVLPYKGIDPVTNFMNYMEDKCMEQFTVGQAEVLQESIKEHKPTLFLVVFYLVSLICVSAKDDREDYKWNIPRDGDDEDIPPYEGQVDELTDKLMLKKQQTMRRRMPKTLRKPKMARPGGEVDARKKMFDPSLESDQGPILDDILYETGGGRCAIKYNKGEVMLPDRISKKNERRKLRQNNRKGNNKKNTKRVSKRSIFPEDEDDLKPAVDPNFYVKIPVKLHVIYSRFGGWIDGSKIKRTINRLNRAYEGVLGKVVGPDTGIRFVLDEVTRTDDMKMFFYCDLYYKELKAKYVVEPEKYINIITCDPYHDTAGWSSFPHEGPENSSIHGIFLHHEALFGSIRFPRWNRGMTLIHEMGHYLGLYHTFHNEKCHNASHPEEDDGVIDTPPEAMMALWCDDIGRDTCTGPGESLPTVLPYKGIDPVTNFMNYMEDKCMEQFTVGQAEVLQESIKEHKPTLFLVVFYLVSLICVSAKDNREDYKWNIPRDGDDEDIPPYEGQVDELTDKLMLKKQQTMRRRMPKTLRKPKMVRPGGEVDARKKMFDPSLESDQGPILDDILYETGGGRCAIKYNKGEVMLPDRISKKNERRKLRQNNRKGNNKKNTKRVSKRSIFPEDEDDLKPAVDPNFYVKIPVKLHVIYSRFGGWIDASKIRKTINRLNRAYEGVLGKVVGPDTGIRFVLDEVTRTDDMKMFFYCDYYYKELKAKYIVEPEKYINIITCDPYHDTAGWSSFPHEGPENSSIHGIFLHHEALFGSIRFPRWNRGMTLIHEMGHYLGLYHTFHNEKCHNASHPEEDDGVIDTPPEAMMALWCDDIGRDTCTGPGESLPTVLPYKGIDPVTNFMNYMEDKCMEQFTVGQAEVLQESIKEHKPTLFLVVFYLVSLICVSAKYNRLDYKWNIPRDGDDDDIPPYEGQVDELTDKLMLKKQQAMRRRMPKTLRKPKMARPGGEVDARKKMFDPSLESDQGPILDDILYETGGGRCAIKYNKGEVMLPDRISKKNERRKLRQNNRKGNNKKNTKRVSKRSIFPEDEDDLKPAVDPNFYVKIPVKLHVIYSRFGGWIDASKIRKTINRLNRAYEGVLGKVVGPDTGIRFVLDEVTRTDDMKMFFYCDYYYKELKAKYIVEPEKYINIITCDPYHDTAGWSSFPHEGPENSSIHGLFIHHEAFPGGDRFPSWNRGITLIHEIGHYLGLYHTFRSRKCNNALNPEEDDGVIDTPPELTSAYWCDDIGRDTCTGPGESLPKVLPYKGIDPVTNYMNYIEDKCMEQFTVGQAEVLQESIKERKPTLCTKNNCQKASKQQKKKKGKGNKKKNV